MKRKRNKKRNEIGIVNKSDKDSRLESLRD